jgi:hypothetical protein
MHQRVGDRLVADGIVCSATARTQKISDYVRLVLGARRVWGGQQGCRFRLIEAVSSTYSTVCTVGGEFAVVMSLVCLAKLMIGFS